MEVRYRREMNHNYMIMDAPEGCSRYECRMLADNAIEGLLKFRLRYGEEKQEFYYEITSKQPLSRIYEKRKVSGEELKRILQSILAAVSRIEGYLLTEEQILLDPDYIYVDPDSFAIELCLLPGYQGDWPVSFSELLKFLLEKADHTDREGVILAYNLYQESRKENYGAADLLKHLSEGSDRIFEKETDRREESEEGWNAEQPENVSDVYQGKESDERQVQEISGTEKRIEKTQIGKTQSEKTQSEKTQIRKTKIRLGELLKGVLVLAASEFLIWYLTGKRGLQIYGPVPIGMAAAGCIIKMVLFSAKEGSKEEVPMHTIVLQEEGPVRETGFESSAWELRTESEEVYQSRVQKQFEEEMKKSREEGTVLLTGKEECVQIGRLEPLSPEGSSILIGYVPFTIGKHPQLSDYCLDFPTVSRLHLRIDKKENVCIITDLNSTNGTVVNDYHLQSNETVSIKTGDVIYLADQGFRFYERG